MRQKSKPRQKIDLGLQAFHKPDEEFKFNHPVCGASENVYCKQKNDESYLSLESRREKCRRS